jgi:hypothetical protein
LKEDTIKILIAIALFVLTFVAKLSIGRKVGKTEMLISLIESPVSIFFLSLSLFVTYMIKITGNISSSTLAVICLIAVGVVIIVVWRNCHEHFLAKKKRWFWIFPINLLLAACCIYFSITMLVSSMKEPIPANINETKASYVAADTLKVTHK